MVWRTIVYPSVTYPYINKWNIRICKNVHNIHNHRMFIRVGFRKTRNTDDSLSTGTKLLSPSLSLGFRHEERKTQFFYADCSSIVNSQLTDPTNVPAHPAVHKLPQTAWKINSLGPSPNLNSLLLFKITKNPSPSLPDMMSFTSPVVFPIWDIYCDICDCHILPARAWKPALNVCT